MVNRRRIFLILGCVVVAVVLYTIIAGPREPSYQGRSLGSWLESYDTRDSSPAAQAEARNAIRRIGTNALPYLLKWLSYEESPVRTRLRERRPDLMSERTWLWIAYEWTRAACAQRALVDLGQGANPAIPELVRLMGDTNAPETARRAAATLTCLGTKEAFPPTLAALTNQHHPMRWVVALNIGTLGTNARAAVPALVQCLEQSNSDLADAAAKSLGEIKLEPALCVPALVRSLKEPDPVARGLGTRALRNFGSEARPAMPALSNLLTDPDEGVRRAAIDALRKIAPETGTKTPVR